jgi:hypothetical protein
MQERRSAPACDAERTSDLLVKSALHNAQALPLAGRLR